MFKRKARRSREFKKNSQVIDFEEARRQRQKKRQAAAKAAQPKSKEKQTASKRKAAKRNRRRLIYTAIILLIIAVIGLSVFNIVSLKLEQKQVAEENEALKAEKEKLTEELSNVDNPEYIEQQARRQLRLIMPGEILYILPEAPQSAAEAASGAASVVPGGGENASGSGSKAGESGGAAAE